MYWTYEPPLIPTFRDVIGNNYNPLFDLALEKACSMAADTAVSNKSTIINKLNQGINNEITYDPNIFIYNDIHPLNVYGIAGGDPSFQCSEHANLLRGLMRSIGLDGTTKYIWSGNSLNGEKWLFTFSNRFATFRIIRNMHDNAPANPHFIFHAVVSAENRMWDPSYGTNYTSITFDEISSYPATDPAFITGNSSQVIRDTWVALDRNTDRTCPHNQ